MTISIKKYKYQDQYDRKGAEKISAFIEHLVKSHIDYESLDSAYEEMAKYKPCLAEDTLDWSESLISNINFA